MKKSFLYSKPWDLNPAKSEGKLKYTYTHISFHSLSLAFYNFSALHFLVVHIYVRLFFVLFWSITSTFCVSQQAYQPPSRAEYADQTHSAGSPCMYVLFCRFGLKILCPFFVCVCWKQLDTSLHTFCGSCCNYNLSKDSCRCFRMS